MYVIILLAKESNEKKYEFQLIPANLFQHATGCSKGALN